MSAQLLSTDDAAAWAAALPAGRSAFGSLGFARAQRRAGLADPRLLVANQAGAEVAYPLALRGLADLPFDVPPTARCDVASPPFTGPITGLQPGSAAEAALAAEVSSCLEQEGVVAEFAHLHPWNASAAIVGGAEADREVVWVDLGLDPERLWAESYSKACRKNIRRAEREGVTVRRGQGPADVAEFHRIYEQTMTRNQAAPGYFFDREYFDAIGEEMPDGARFVLAERDGVVLAATLYLCDDDDVYSYLGGADHAFQALRPTNAVVHATIEWARDAGKKRLVLGGGYRLNDGIFRFKASFSPNRQTLALARRIHRPAEYEALAAAWAEHHGRALDADFFPAYRAAAG